MKSVRIFSHSDYQIWIRESADQKNSEHRHFLRSEGLWMRRLFGDNLCKQQKVLSLLNPFLTNSIPPENIKRSQVVFYFQAVLEETSGKK